MTHSIGVFNGNWKNRWNDHELEPSAQLPADHVWSHYWAVYRKAKKPTKKNGGWILVTYYQETKADMADIFRRIYHGGNFRLRHLIKYGP